MGDVAFEEFVALKPKMCSILVTDSSEYKKAKSLKENVIAIISRNEYKDVLLNKIYLRHSISRIQSKSRKIGTYVINKNVFVLL